MDFYSKFVHRQVVGQKYVRLYPPSETERLYIFPRLSKFRNTSRVSNPEDLEQAE